MSETHNPVIVPRYVLKSLERALSTARQRASVASQRVTQLEEALASMKDSKNGGGAVEADSDNADE